MTAPMVLLGYGLTGRSVVAALSLHGHEVVVVDDRPSADTIAAAVAAGVTLRTGLDDDDWTEVLRGCEAFVPSPGVPDHHIAIRTAREQGVRILSEFDLAAHWDSRPTLAITGTDGKTTVTMMTVAILDAAGIKTAAVGNTDLPLVEAIADPTYETFVVEASSFRLGYSEYFAPRVGTWLNFGPDHLDQHHSLEAYELSKAKIWAHLPEGGLAIACAESPVVMRHVRQDRRSETFGLQAGDHHVVNEALVLDGEHLLHIDELWRALPHDQTNALAAAATAREAGASVDAIRSGLRTFRGLPHRVELVVSRGGVRWYNDSKATTPHAVGAALGGFESVVLIAGGRNKGLDLSPLREHAHRVRAVVAIGDAADEIVATFEGAAPTHRASSMAEAVAMAADLADPGTVVLLSPACTSFDWYSSYKARGEDFSNLVRTLVTGDQPDNGDVAPSSLSAPGDPR